jgi:hemerythrin superfamily protein
MPLGTTQSKGGTAGKSKSVKGQSKPQDAITLLMADHDEVEALFKKFQKAKDGDSGKTQIVQQICMALTVHAEIEEDIFYPAARDALAEKGEDMLDEAEVEHASIKSLVEQLKNAEPDEDMYDAKVKVLCEYVTHHVKEEEGEMFPKLKKAKLDLDELGAELAERKMELMGAE